ncbi:MAG TPA: recombinase family protein [Kribbella sp.]|jgi:DNA invertase Pin-like site-specific DNA recombinase
MTATVATGIEWGYARVSTKKQDLHRQIHALTKYGIPDGLAGDAQRLYVDKLTGTNFNRQGWFELRPRLRAGDVLVLPELDRLGRSQTEMLQLFTELTEMGVHVNVIGGPIPFDTRIPGPATEMAKALLVFLGQVELIYKNERVASARESGKTAHRPRKLTPQLENDLAGEFCTGTVPVDALAAKYGVSRATVYRIAREHQVKNNARRTFTPAGRGKSLTPAQIGTAQRLKANGLSIRAIAAAVGSSRATVHRALTAAPATDITTELAQSLSTANEPASAAGPQRLACPGCGTVPNGKIVAARLREEVQTDWWSTTDTDPDRIVVTQHCGRCQPHSVYALACLACGDGPLLTGELAELARDTEPQELPAVVTNQLTATGWQWATTSYGAGWVCRQTACESAPVTIGASR